MSKVFFIIVDERDRERFRTFKLQRNKPSKNIIPWGLSSNIKKDIWKKIFKNDLIYFAHTNTTFSIFGKVLKKQINNTLSTKLWGTSPRIKLMDHFIFFTVIKETSIPFYQMIKFSKKKLSSEAFPGLYEAKNEFKKYVEQKDVPKTKKHYVKLKPVTIPVDFAGSPETKTEKVTRFIRDTQKTRLLKKKYHNKCQVCSYQIPIGSQKFYSEVHHLYPLKDGGDDNFNNMLVLCPTHHAEFDYKVIGIDLDGITIIDKNGKSVGKLIIMKDHKIHEKNILFHLQGLKS